MNIEIKIGHISKEYSKDLYEIYSDPKVCQYFDIFPFKKIDEAERKIIEWQNQEKDKKQIRYGIFHKNKLIGTCGIYSIYWHQNRASIGYDLNSKYWNQGIISKALSLLLDELKDKYKLHRIQATILEDNIASKHVLKKLGFKFEGLLRDYEKWKGKYVNLELYSKLL